MRLLVASTFGNGAVDSEVIARLQSVLSDDDRGTLKQDITVAPEWLRPIIRQITDNV